jgi:hypothetical protein
VGSAICVSAGDGEGTDGLSPRTQQPANSAAITTRRNEVILRLQSFIRQSPEIILIGAQLSEIPAK